MKAAGKMQASIDGAIIDFGHLAVNAVELLRARKRAAGPFEEKLQQAEFSRREMYLARTPAYALILRGRERCRR